MSRSPTALVITFAENVAAQNQCIRLGNSSAGNKHAKQYVAAARALLAGGEKSIDEFTTLLTHPDDTVRSMAAAFLLKNRTEQSVLTLRQLATGSSLAAFGAQMTLERYSSGVLEIDT